MIRLKKIAVILLLGVLLYNWFGYQALCYWMQQQATQQMESRLDRHQYKETDLVEIRIPLYLPYISSTTAFERCDGQIELNGKHYAYVKRRVQNDSLVLLCVVQGASQKIREAGNDYFRQVNDLTHPGHQGKETASFFKTLLIEYQPAQYGWSFTPLVQDHIHSSYQAAVFISSCTTSTPEQPPEPLPL